MKVKDLLKKIENKKQNVLFVDKIDNICISDILSKNDLLYNDKYNNEKIDKIKVENYGSFGIVIIIYI